MKILHLSTQDVVGGAARAAFRIHRAQVASGIDSHMLVLHRSGADGRVVQTTPPPLPVRFCRRVGRQFQRRAQRGWSTQNPVMHSFGQNSAWLVDKLNRSDADILNLHWISDLLSVVDIGRLRKPIVWTCHDMWAFSGGEHYGPDDDDARFRRGYLAENRPSGETGPDLNRRTWEEKRLRWSRQYFNIVGPSRWLADCARQSLLFSGSPVHVIPYPLEMKDLWRPIGRDASRAVLNLPLHKKLILFGADGGTADPRKGGDLLRETLVKVVATLPENVELLVYGESRGTASEFWPCPVHWLGEVRDDRILAAAYSAADVMVVPSRQDNLPNTAIEAQACGTPVVAFNVGGIPDIVEHLRTGYLARPFDVSELSEGVLWVLNDERRRRDLQVASRISAEAKFSETAIAKAYADLYGEILEDSHRTSKS